MTIQKKPVCLSLWNDKFAEFNLHQHFGLDPEKYVGYSIDDLEDMDVKLDKHIHDGPKNDKTLVFYDKSENE